MAGEFVKIFNSCSHAQDQLVYKKLLFVTPTLQLILSTKKLLRKCVVPSLKLNVIKEHLSSLRIHSFKFLRFNKFVYSRVIQLYS